MKGAPDVSDAQLRDAGYTAKARNYPLSENAVRLLATRNGVDLSVVPSAWWYAPNEYVRDQLERDAT